MADLVARQRGWAAGEDSTRARWSIAGRLLCRPPRSQIHPRDVRPCRHFEELGPVSCALSSTIRGEELGRSMLRGRWNHQGLYPILEHSGLWAHEAVSSLVPAGANENKCNNNTSRSHPRNSGGQMILRKSTLPEFGPLNLSEMKMVGTTRLFRVQHLSRREHSGRINHRCLEEEHRVTTAED